MVDPEAYVDANPSVCWICNHPEYGKVALEWIKRIESADRKRYVTSTLAIYRVLVIMAGLTGRSLYDRELVSALSSEISPGSL
ncbi:MAG: hypothetical protein ACQXXL_04510 [Candidatus Methanosuratincola sp.]|jgi:hypothetical protein|nr:hypothetical protein [Candidatus Methanosuratincola sp.]